MKTFFFIFIILSKILLSDTIDIYELYQKQKFLDACNLGVKNLSQNRDDEPYILLYAFSCLKAGRIDRLSIPIVLLGNTKESRQNSAYFSIILMQKKLLISSLIDGVDISGLKLPSTDFLLSKIFNLYSKSKQNIPSKNAIILTDNDDMMKQYKVQIARNKQGFSLVVEEIYDKMTTKRHIYH